jgi:uncharacterized protein involved in exopolysaccharide biosynthesis
MKCSSMNAQGEPCDAPEHMVIDGACPAHREGGREHLRAIAALGGAATAAKHAAEGFKPDEIADLTDIESAMRALDVIRQAAMTRRLTHTEANAASKAVAEWVKAHGVLQTQRLVGELQRSLDEKAEEIQDLRKQLATQSRSIRKVS